MKKLLAVLLCMAPVFALSISTFAAEFTPSAESKGSPEVVLNEDGEKFVIYNPETGEELESEDSYDLQLTAETEVGDGTIDKEKVNDMIEEAKEEIAEAKTVGDLPSGTNLKAELEERILTADDPAVRELELEDLVVSDVFDISLTMNGESITQVPPGQVIEFSLQTNFSPDDEVYVLVRCEGSTGWVLLDKESVWIDENGVMHIRATQLCVMAFVVPAYGKQPIDDSGEEHSSPKTGSADRSWLPVAGGVCIAAALGVVLYKKKARKN